MVSRERESRIETCIYCTLYFVYVLRAVLLELYKIVHRFESMFNRDVRLKVHLKNHPSIYKPPTNLANNSPGEPQAPVGVENCPRRRLHPSPARQHADGARTNAQTPRHEEVLDVIIGQAVAALAALLPQGQNIFLRIVLCSK